MQVAEGDSKKTWCQLYRPRTLWYVRILAGEKANGIKKQTGFHDCRLRTANGAVSTPQQMTNPELHWINFAITWKLRLET